MAGPRPFALLRTDEHWLRSSHQGTWLERDGAVVSLGEDPAADQVAAAGTAPAALAGLAIDGECWLYHAHADAGQVERQLWNVDAGLDRQRAAAQPVDLFHVDPAQVAGDFDPVVAPSGPLLPPLALAVDAADRLYVGETARRRVVIYDLRSRRLLRRVRLPGRPVDLVADGRGVLLLTADPPALWRLPARQPARPLSPSIDLRHATRLARLADGPLFLLLRPPGAPAQIVRADGKLRPLEVPGAVDLELAGTGRLVVARGPDDDLLVFDVDGPAAARAPSLKARGYDGLGLVRVPDGRIGFFTTHGFRHAVPARRRFVRAGRVTSFVFDAGEPRAEWGRLFVDACVPEGTELRFRCASSDEPPAPPFVAHGHPGNRDPAEVPTDDLAPLLPELLDVGPVDGRLHRRSGPEQAYARREPDDAFETYEAPVHAPPGRYLWLTLALAGNGRRTPKVRGARIEHAGHDWLGRLPKVFSQEEPAADFLRRYLHLPAGLVSELEARSLLRVVLVDPRSAPAETLAWLAGFVGLAFDERWPVAARRQLIAESAELFRWRGTRRGLLRFAEILVPVPIRIIEHWQLRGVGGPLLGGERPGEAVEVWSRSVLGSGFRVSGALGQLEDQPGAPEDLAAGFRRRAHRFTVIVPASLSSEAQAALASVFQLHRPAHTVYDLCTVDAGLRVGHGLHVGLTSVIGPSGGFDRTLLGDFVLGRSSVLGQAEAGTRPGAGRVALDTRVG